MVSVPASLAAAVAVVTCCCCLVLERLRLVLVPLASVPLLDLSPLRGVKLEASALVESAAERLLAIFASFLANN